MACVEHCPLRDHRGREVGEGDNAVAALWDGDEVIGVICVDNLFSHQPITERQLEILRFYATTLGHLITRKRTEEALRKSAERLRLAAHASNVGLWDWDLQTNRVVFSCEWKSQLGYEEHEIGADYSEWERRLHPDDLAPTLAALRACLDGSHPEYAVEFRLRHKDGSYRWIYARGEVFHDVRGKPVRMLGCHVDITERKQAEEAQQKRGWFRNRLTH
jgi:PAS domain S-box-containing protein